MGLNSNYATNPKAEAEGCWFELDETTKVLLRRAGGANKEYDTTHTELLQPYMRRLKVGAGGKIPPGLVEPLKAVSRLTYARSVIKGWQTKVNGEWQDGIEPYTVDEEGACEAAPLETAADLMPVTEKNILKLLENYPEVYTDILEICSEADAFRAEELEVMEGNS